MVEKASRTASYRWRTCGEWPELVHQTIHIFGSGHDALNGMRDTDSDIRNSAHLLEEVFALIWWHADGEFRTCCQSGVQLPQAPGSREWGWVHPWDQYHECPADPLDL